MTKDFKKLFVEFGATAEMAKDSIISFEQALKGVERAMGKASPKGLRGGLFDPINTRGTLVASAAIGTQNMFQTAMTSWGTEQLAPPTQDGDEIRRMFEAGMIDVNEARRLLGLPPRTVEKERILNRDTLAEIREEMDRRGIEPPSDSESVFEDLRRKRSEESGRKEVMFKPQKRKFTFRGSSEERLAEAKSKFQTERNERNAEKEETD